MKHILIKHKEAWRESDFWLRVLAGLLFLAISMFANYHANSYTLENANHPVTDIILDNIPVLDVYFLFADGAIVFLLLTLAILFYHPRRIPFVLKSTALFTLIRSAFMTMTHLAPPFGALPMDPEDLLYKVSFGTDLFFSGHVGLPFLFALIFWREKVFRYFFLASSFAGGVIVLLGHLHYSIDVFSALFISFGIFHLSKFFFRKDYQD